MHSNFFTVLYCRSRTRQAVRAAGGKIPLSFDYVISTQHSEDPLPATTTTEVGAASGTTTTTTAVETTVFSMNQPAETATEKS